MMITDNDDVEIANAELKKNKKQGRAKVRTRVAGSASPFLCMSDVLAIVPVSKATIYNMMKEGRFPKQRTIGGSVAIWSRKEVMDWVASILG